VEYELRERIAVGRWSTGQALPPVAQLAADYGVSGVIQRVEQRLGRTACGRQQVGNVPRLNRLN
jgi:DNA-binding transcriptional MocR family regulator